MTPRQIILYALGYSAGLYLLYIIIYNKHVRLMYKVSILSKTVEVADAKIATGFATFEVIFIMFFIFYIIFLTFLWDGSVSRERLTRFNFFY